MLFWVRFKVARGTYRCILDFCTDIYHIGVCTVFKSRWYLRLDSSTKLCSLITELPPYYLQEKSLEVALQPAVHNFVLPKCLKTGVYTKVVVFNVGYLVCRTVICKRVCRLWTFNSSVHLSIFVWAKRNYDLTNSRRWIFFVFDFYLFWDNLWLLLDIWLLRLIVYLPIDTSLHMRQSARDEPWPTSIPNNAKDSTFHLLLPAYCCRLRLSSGTEPDAETVDSLKINRTDNQLIF